MKIIKASSDIGGMNKSKGSRDAPNMIVSALDNFYYNEDSKKSEFDIEEIKINHSNIDENNSNIYESVKKSDEDLILIGGDHSITYSAFKAFVKKSPGAGILIFDAHPDCENDFRPPTHEDYLRVLIEEGIVDPSKVILVGVRNWHLNEIQFIKEKNIKCFTMKEIFERGVKEVCDSIMYVARKWNHLYLSIDIDCVDPAFAPGTGYTEPGGLSSREIIYFVQRIKLLKNLKIADLVEVNPSKDVNNLTVSLGAKIIKELVN